MLLPLLGLGALIAAVAYASKQREKSAPTPPSESEILSITKAARSPAEKEYLIAALQLKKLRDGGGKPTASQLSFVAKYAREAGKTDPGYLGEAYKLEKEAAAVAASAASSMTPAPAAHPLPSAKVSIVESLRRARARRSPAENRYMDALSKLGRVRHRAQYGSGPGPTAVQLLFVAKLAREAGKLEEAARLEKEATTAPAARPLPSAKEAAMATKEAATAKASGEMREILEGKI